ncbi:hypothetical protein DU505_19455 [Billgrantia montanilacus]|uniref:Uncharacterized protein n=1 Tax=Billgrantia montanilacus TaxID=2282305 RepID=A0A368TQG3_9GAMM|nr:hypothetical protein DU505_19455 [Halomonas montanilacus]
MEFCILTKRSNSGFQLVGSFAVDIFFYRNIQEFFIHYYSLAYNALLTGKLRAQRVIFPRAAIC